ELDKIIDRSLAQQAPPPAQQQAPPVAPPQQQSRDRGYEGYEEPRQGYPQQGHYKKKRKESWLSEIFD
ncbi:MAG: hypothetical protein Q7J48_13940, partial [Nocardioides sp.]|nr:hypothetical protein [Nocardioides sp.]